MMKFAEEENNEMETHELAVEVVMECLRKIKAIRRSSDFMRRLWNVDRKLCIASTLRSNELAEFLIEHIPADKLDKVTK